MPRCGSLWVCRRLSTVAAPRVMTCDDSPKVQAPRGQQLVLSIQRLPPRPSRLAHRATGGEKHPIRAPAAGSRERVRAAAPVLYSCRSDLSHRRGGRERRERRGGTARQPQDHPQNGPSTRPSRRSARSLTPLAPPHSPRKSVTSSSSLTSPAARMPVVRPPPSSYHLLT